MNPKKFLIQFYVNNKEAMEISDRFISEKFIEGDRGIPIVELKDLSSEQTFKIWNYFDSSDFVIGYQYSLYSGEISFK